MEICIRQPGLNGNTTLSACKYNVYDNNIYFVLSSVSSILISLKSQ